MHCFMMRRKLIGLTLGLAILAASQPVLRGQASSDYKIAPSDTIVIDVLGEKDLNKELRVSATGTINYFLLGTLEVAGKTTAEVTEMLTEMLNKDYLVNPQVSVDVKEYRVREVFVNGAVTKPGAVVITGEQDLTILGAIFRAGGLTPRANGNQIRFTRPGHNPVTLKYEDLAKQRPEQMIKLQPGDVIDVGDKLF